MGELIGWLIGAVVIISIVVTVVTAIVVFIYTLILFISANTIVLAEKIFGSWVVFHPSVSWAVMGFTIGSLIYFAIVESPKLNRSNIKPLLIMSACILLLLSPILGPATAGITLDMSGYVNKGLVFFNISDVMMSGETKGKQLSPIKELSSNDPMEQSQRQKNELFICIAANGINLRSGPSSKYNSIGVVRRGETVKKIDKKKSQTGSNSFFYYVKTENGTVGWAWAGKNEKLFMLKTD